MKWYLLEALDSFADAAADFRQFLGPKNEGGHAGNNDQFRHAQTEHGVATQTFVSSPTIHVHGYPY